jgi:hypothetical protein
MIYFPLNECLHCFLCYNYPYNATNVHAPKVLQIHNLCRHRIRRSNPNSLSTRQIIHYHQLNRVKNIPLIRIIVPKPFEFLSAIARALSTNASTEPSF